MNELNERREARLVIVQDIFGELLQVSPLLMTSRFNVFKAGASKRQLAEFAWFAHDQSPGLFNRPSPELETAETIEEILEWAEHGKPWVPKEAPHPNTKAEWLKNLWFNVEIPDTKWEWHGPLDATWLSQDEAEWLRAELDSLVTYAGSGRDAKSLYVAGEDGKQYLRSQRDRDERSWENVVDFGSMKLDLTREPALRKFIYDKGFPQLMESQETLNWHGDSKDFIALQRQVYRKRWGTYSETAVHVSPQVLEQLMFRQVTPSSSVREDMKKHAEPGFKPTGYFTGYHTKNWLCSKWFNHNLSSGLTKHRFVSPVKSGPKLKLMCRHDARGYWVKYKPFARGLWGQ